jgi:hypothetical protein
LRALFTRSRRVWVATVSTIAVVMAVSVSSASAASGSATDRGAAERYACNLELLSSLGLTGTASAARGTQLREPKLAQEAVEVPRRAQGSKRPSTSTVVPTYVHVVTPDGVTGNVSLRKIKEQIEILTLTFGGFYGGFNTKFAFDLAGVTRTVNATWYNAGPSTRAEHEMKRALREGGDNALNMYLTTAGAYLGWAYFPSVLDSNQAYLDGIVVDWESLPGTSDAYEGQYDLGYTATHEAGHWLNLYHTFDGGCGELGDRVADTPSEREATFGCPEGKDSCIAKPGLDPIHNYMDYSFDACYTEFTAGQSARMRDAWNFWRAGG